MEWCFSHCTFFLERGAPVRLLLSPFALPTPARQLVGECLNRANGLPTTLQTIVTVQASPEILDPLARAGRCLRLGEANGESSNPTRAQFKKKFMKNKIKNEASAQHDFPQKSSVQKEEAEKTFVEYLRQTLIPDLLESGRTATATDFETACRFIKKDLPVAPDGVNDEDAEEYCNEWKTIA